MARFASLLPSFATDDGEAPVIQDSRSVSMSTGPSRGKQFWTVQFRAPQTRKHKTWDDDGVLQVVNDQFILFDTEGRKLTSGKVGMALRSGLEVKLGAREIRVDENIPHSDFYSGACFGKSNASAPAVEPPRKKFKPLLPTTNIPITSRATVHADTAAEQSEDTASLKIPPRNTAVESIHKGAVKQVKPLHDPNAPGAVVMNSPSELAQKKFNSHNLPIIPVVIDPLLSQHLRPHQIEGVKFLYECVIGSRKHEGHGGILADDMGLGKTLQTIALIWTVLRQSPYGGGPLVGKVLIVCPVTLIKNWKLEFHKWLGRDRLGIFVGDQDKRVIQQFLQSKIHQILIIGYEKLRTVMYLLPSNTRAAVIDRIPISKDLAYCSPPIGLIICDEGHRLKSAGSKSHQMFEALKCRRRIILSGTPIQNDLSEFHAMADFCNPGLLDSYSNFKRIFEGPIMKSRAPDASTKDRELGLGRMEKLLTTSTSFVLRREATLLSKYLPPKYEYVLFVKPTDTQRRIFANVLRPDKLNSIINGSTARSLALITRLTKLSTSPSLLVGRAENNGGGDLEDDSIESIVLRETSKEGLGNHDSGKLTILFRMLHYLRENTTEKCVIVSHYTATLDIIQEISSRNRFTYFRLDGQTPAPKRSEFVEAFNKTSQKDRFLFLLSAKAGGVGLNLIGASRLILIDSDWNPSHDLQAMGRIHRDGQKRPVFVYRLLTTGTIDEKIYQRQITKMGLSNSMLQQTTEGEAASGTDTFSRDELRDIFTVHDDTPCHTHALMACACSLGGGEEANADEHNADSENSDVDESDLFRPPETFVAASQMKPEQYERKEKHRKNNALQSLAEWTHVNCLFSSAIAALDDDMLNQFVCRPFGDAAKEEDGSGVQSLSLDAMAGGDPVFIFGRCSKTPLNLAD